MELKTFIEDTLVQVAIGIRDANIQLNQEMETDEQMFLIPEDPHGQQTTVAFDVAVTVSEADKNTGGGGIKVYALQAGGEKQHEAASERVSRITFAVTTSSIIGAIKYHRLR